MSNHDVGYAFSELGSSIIELYEAGKISKKAAISLIRAGIEVVNRHDGNPQEATASIVEAGYCGLCFRKCKDLTSVFDNDDDLANGVYGEIEYFNDYGLFRDYWDIALHHYLCPKCKAGVIRDYLDNM